MTINAARSSLYRRPSGTYYTIQDGQVWQWQWLRRWARWTRCRAPRLPADARYATMPPHELLRAVADAAHEGKLWRYNLHRGQKHERSMA